MARGELHVPREVWDGEAVALLLLDLGDVGATVLLLVHHPAEELFEYWREEKSEGGFNCWCCFDETGAKPSSPLLTEDVGFDSEGEVRVVPQDVHGLGDGDVLQVLPIDLHDLKQQQDMSEPGARA